MTDGGDEIGELVREEEVGFHYNHDISEPLTRNFPAFRSTATQTPERKLPWRRDPQVCDGLDTAIDSAHVRGYTRPCQTGDASERRCHRR